MDAATRSHQYPKNDVTRFATGGNKAQRYLGTNRQICLHVSEEMFNIVKAEALREGCSLGEVVRQCLELVLK